MAAAAIRLVTFTTPISLESAADQAIAATIGVVNVMIIELLLRHGATADDMDANGKTVRVAAASDWIRELLT